MNAVLHSLSTIGSFLIYLGACAALALAFMRFYVWITPYDEFKLIEDKDPAPAIALGGSLIGFTLPIASLVIHSTGLIDLLIWSVIALAVQLAAFYGIYWRYPDLPARIKSGDLSIAWFIALCSIAAGILNAACLVY